MILADVCLTTEALGVFTAVVGTLWSALAALAYVVISRLWSKVELAARERDELYALLHERGLSREANDAMTRLRVSDPRPG